MKRVRHTLKKYFIPHEENDHKPHILRARSVAFVLAIALVVEGTLWFGATQLAPRSSLFGIIVANALVDETNQSRVANGATGLTVSPLLTAAAQDKADDMVANNYFAHTSPSGLTPWYWFQQVGYGFEYAGENLAVNFSDSQDVTDAWMNSPEHRANILDANYTQIGIATAEGSYDGHPATYVVELFGTPVPPAAPAEPIIPFLGSANAAGTGANATTTSATSVPAKPKPVATVVVATSAVAATTFATATTQMTTATLAVAGATVKTVAPQVNAVQRAAANPRSLADDIYLAIIALFALALGINVFVKIRIQHPQLIFGGMLVILVAGLLIVLNQHLLAGAAIL